MVYELLNIGKHGGAIRLGLSFAIGFATPSAIGLRPCFAIAVIFLSTKTLSASSTEYVFTAPPEVNRQIVEVPPSETDYPLYECSSEAISKLETATEANNALDTHDCNCQDCENTLEESELAPADQLEKAVEQP
jgi:hypothetical protein